MPLKNYSRVKVSDSIKKYLKIIKMIFFIKKCSDESTPVGGIITQNVRPPLGVGSSLSQYLFNNVKIEFIRFLQHLRFKPIREKFK